MKFSVCLLLLVNVWQGSAQTSTPGDEDSPVTPECTCSPASPPVTCPPVVTCPPEVTCPTQPLPTPPPPLGKTATCLPHSQAILPNIFI